MDYELTMNAINDLAAKANQLYLDLNKKIEQNHTTFIDPTLADQRDTQTTAAQIAELYRQAQQTLDSAVKQKQDDINKRYHGDVTADQLANINQLAKYDLSEDELAGYLDKYKDNLPLLKAFELVIKDKGWLIDGLTYDNEIEFLKRFKSSMQAVVDGMQNGSPKGLPLETKIASNMLTGHVKDWKAKVKSSAYTLRHMY